MSNRVVTPEPEKDDRALATRNAAQISTLAAPESNELATISIAEMKGRFRKIQEAINDVLKDGVDYGIVPGTSRKDAQGNEIAKPSLYKAGAEKLATLFLFDAEFDNNLTYDGDHLTVTSYCTLVHIPTGRRVGSGSAICSTRESKYAYRLAGLKCPSCGKETLGHTKRSPTDWWCNSYKGGCSANFPGDDPKITGQERGQIANDKLPDQYNTVIKMAEKRAKVGAIIGATGASEFVTQDLEDLADNGVITGTDTGSGASEAKKGGTDPSDTKKGPETKAKGGRKGTSGAASNGKSTMPSDLITEDDVNDMKLTCEILETDSEELLDFYRSANAEAKARIKSFSDFTPAELAHFHKSSESATKKQNKDLSALLATAKAKQGEGAGQAEDSEAANQ